jgi:signal transduction histidine kinase
MLLKHTNIDLEKEVKERTEEIHQLLQQKDEFIGQLGHDLKTPLSVLMNIIPMIQESSDDAQVKEDCDLAIRNTKYIKDLVIQTLRLANISSSNQSFDKKCFSLKENVKKSIEDNIVIFNDKNIRIENRIPKDLEIYGDELQIKEVFTNLFNNSVKYMSQNGVLTLNAQEEEEFIIISVKDTGKGMTKDQLSHIFNDFYKADTSRHELESSGLGLPICKRIIEKHGGHIWAESEGIGKGSTFYFTLPLQRTEKNM